MFELDIQYLRAKCVTRSCDRSVNRVMAHDIRDIPRISYLPTASFDPPLLREKKRRKKVYLEYTRAISCQRFLTERVSSCAKEVR